MRRPLVSILINNYNYGRFLTDAINSALRQTYSPVEVIVVDDGSTDNSRDVIASYGSKISVVFKNNSGQASAFNTGIEASRGDIMCFLDADDFFYPDKVGRVVQIFNQSNLETKGIMVHHLTAVKDAVGQDLDRPLFGTRHRSPLNLYDFARRHRFLWFEAGPTSAISMNRALTDRLFPVPENGIPVAADNFLVYGALLIGEVHSLPEPLSGYRLHGNNSFLDRTRRLPPEFMNTLQSYLNVKLSEHGLLPILSFDDSMCAWPNMRADRRWGKLMCHMLKTCIRDHDRETFIYAYHMAMELCISMKRTIERLA